MSGYYDETSLDAPLRTADHVTEVAEVVADQDTVNDDFAKGVRKPSMFRHLPGFDILRDIPPETMHLIYF